MNRTVTSIIFAILVLALWEVSIFIFGIPSYLVPRPTVIFQQALWDLPRILPHFAITFEEAAFGFALGSIMGAFLAVLFSQYRLLEYAILPYAIAFKSLPIVAIAPLLVVWFGSGLLPKIMVAATISFFPVLVNSTKGLLSVEREAWDLFASLSASRMQTLMKLQLPAATPYFFSGLRVSATLAVIGAIVGEMAGADRGLGFYIMVASHRLETVDMFVGIIYSSLLSLFFYYLVVLTERILAPWSYALKHVE